MYEGQEQSQIRFQELKSKYEQLKLKPLNLNITRGVPSKEQLDLSEPMLGILQKPDDFISQGNVDIRNYGELTGLMETKKLFGEVLGVHPEEILIGGNSSLSLMYLVLSSKMFSGKRPWKEAGTIKFLCPVPGYDRHFAMTEKLGIEMIPIDMNENGPDMDQVEKMVAQDASIKGIWCVPTYSNPSGAVYSDEVVDRLAAMETAAEDFTIMWDNAYIVHHLTEDKHVAKNLLTTCQKMGHENRVWMFCSTSKVTFPGAGIAVLATSKENMAFIIEELSYQTIGFDKLNQMRHVKFLKNPQHLAEHMEKQAAIINPKFEIVKEKLRTTFAETGMLEWTEPKGGYFVHLTTMEGCATEIVQALANIGVKVTSAGATYPYGENPKDNSIRLAPTSVSPEDLTIAMDAICLCIEMISLKNQLEITV